MRYKVELDVYHGPLDLLLFLIRRDEVDIYDIPIAAVTEQFVAYVSVLKELDPDFAADFLVMAATLMEIKSRTLLPRPEAIDVDEEDDFTDPRMELVRQLLEYKKFKDAARALGDAREEQGLRHRRMPVMPPVDPDEVDLDEVQMWDLLDAFNRLLEATGRRQQQHEVVYDDTPIALHAADIQDALQRCGGSQTFQTFFEGRTKSQLIGLFLALLELLRQRRIRAVQRGEFAPIEVELLDAEPVFVDERRDYASRSLDEVEEDAAGFEDLVDAVESTSHDPEAVSEPGVEWKADSAEEPPDARHPLPADEQAEESTPSAHPGLRIQPTASDQE